MQSYVKGEVWFLYLIVMVSETRGRSEKNDALILSYLLSLLSLPPPPPPLLLLLSSFLNNYNCIAPIATLAPTPTPTPTPIPTSIPTPTPTPALT
jgi:hypothetical protein